MVGEKVMSYQTHNQATEINEAVHIVLTFLHTQIIVFRSYCASGSQPSLELQLSSSSNSSEKQMKTLTSRPHILRYTDHICKDIAP